MAEKFKVFNTCKYMIGVKTENGGEININPGNFRMVDKDDISYIDNECRGPGFFRTGKLVVLNEANEKVPLEELYVYADEDTPKHLTDDDIRAMLKLSPKKLEEALDKVTEEEEKYAIYKVASETDLPASKLKILDEKIPGRNWLKNED